MTIDNKRDFFAKKNSTKHRNQYFIGNEENNANISHKKEEEKLCKKESVTFDF
jgi:hypothetical protein